MSGYTFKSHLTGIGTEYEFEGPGMIRHGNGAHCLRDCDAEYVARMLARAYEAGRKARAEEIRKALGIHDGPWGVSCER